MKRKNKSLLVLGIAFVSTLLLFLNSCVSQEIKEKSGIQLWGENCSRCHDAPGPGEFTGAHWDVVTKHMRVRANLTKDETEKILEYLKGN